MATITVLHEQLMPRSGARATLDQRKERMGNRLKPRWGTLYTLSFLGGCLLIAGEVFIGSTAWRGVWDFATAGSTLGAMGGWVRANRLALAMESCTAINKDEPSEDMTRTPMRPRTLSTLHKRAA